MNDTPEFKLSQHIDNLPEIVAAIPLQLGDRVIFKFDQPLDQKLAEKIKEQIKAALGDDFPCLVIGEGVDVTVYSEASDG
jgi:hypothetical protein